MGKPGFRGKTGKLAFGGRLRGPKHKKTRAWTLPRRFSRRLHPERTKGSRPIGAASRVCVLRYLEERDARDAAARVAAPLKPAADAFVLDTTAIDADQAFKTALDYILSRRGR